MPRDAARLIFDQIDQALIARRRLRQAPPDPVRGDAPRQFRMRGQQGRRRGPGHRVAGLQRRCARPGAIDADNEQARPRLRREQRSVDLKRADPITQPIERMHERREIGAAVRILSRLTSLISDRRYRVALT